jgi:hypothetical protein
MFNSEVIFIEKIFHISTGWNSINYLDSWKGKIAFLKNGSQIVKMKTFEFSELKLLFSLYKHMEEILSFYGGVSPIGCYKNQKKKLEKESKMVYLDFRVFIQFLNVNFYLQEKLAEDVGTTREHLIAAIEAIRQDSK